MKLTTMTACLVAALGMQGMAIGQLEVVPVPWVSSNVDLPHSTYNGVSTVFKAIARGGTGTYDYEWDFNGDGTFDTYLTTTDRYNLGATYTYPMQSSDRLFFATVRVTSGPEVATAQYPVYVHVAPLPLWARVNKAVDDGLWYLHVNQTRGILGDGTPYGAWTAGSPYGTWPVTFTGAAVEAFEIQGHLPEGDYALNPYVETVQRGLAYLLSQMIVQPIMMQPAGDPDTNSNGFGIGCYTDYGHSMYECGVALMTFASSQAPDRIAETGPTNVVGRPYHEIVQDMVDYLAYGQVDSTYGVYRGGWRYSANYTSADNSTSQWPVIGLEAAETSFGAAGVVVPQFVRDELNLWINYIQDPVSGGSWYSGPSSTNIARTGGLLAEMKFYGDDMSLPRNAAALDYIDVNWGTDPAHFPANSYYAFYSVMKGMRLMEVETFPSGLDWYADDTQGYAPYLIASQNADGSWPAGLYSRDYFAAAWAILILQPHPTVVPPVAVADAMPTAAPPGTVITFAHSGSYHPLAPDRTIVAYRWDFDDDGLWDFETTDPFATPTWQYFDMVGCNDPGVEHLVVLEVEDDLGVTAQDDQSVLIEISLLNHPPVAIGDPTPSVPSYEVGQGSFLLLDASLSYDPDSVITGDDKCDPDAPDDYITLYEWDLDNDSVFDVTGMTYLFDTPNSWAVGTIHTVQLRVTDDGSWAGPLGGGPLSAETTVSILVVPNQPPDCSGAFANIGRLWPPNHKWVDIEIMGCVDPDGDPIMISVTAITQDEPVDAPGMGDGRTTPDGDGVGGTACAVRAEREGGSNGRVYYVWFVASDPAGAECDGYVTVEVPHSRWDACVDDGQVYDSTMP